VLSALRFVRTCVALDDDFYTTRLDQYRVMDVVMDTFLRNGPSRYNLVNSAVMEIVELVRVRNLKPLVVAIVSKYGERLQAIQCVSLFKQLQLKHEQNLDAQLHASSLATLSSAASGTHVAHAHVPERLRSFGADSEEDLYFQTDYIDVHDAEVNHAMVYPTTPTALSGASSPPSLRLVLPLGSSTASSSSSSSSGSSAVGLSSVGAPRSHSHSPRALSPPPLPPGSLSPPALAQGLSMSGSSSGAAAAAGGGGGGLHGHGSPNSPRLRSPSPILSPPSGYTGASGGAHSPSPTAMGSPRLLSQQRTGSPSGQRVVSPPRSPTAASRSAWGSGYDEPLRSNTLPLLNVSAVSLPPPAMHAATTSSGLRSGGRTAARLSPSNFLTDPPKGVRPSCVSVSSVCTSNHHHHHKHPLIHFSFIRSFVHSNLPIHSFISS
jgi:hypothetical protein